MKKLIECTIFSCVCCSILLLSPLPAYPFQIAATGAGLSIVVNSTDDIIATYVGRSEETIYSNDLFLNETFIFNNRSSEVGSTVNLGSFEIGTELRFRLHVIDTEYDFYTGAADRNPDKQAHARVENILDGETTLVSFEDLYGGAFNYNDLSFTFSHTSGISSPLNSLQTLNSVAPLLAASPIPEPSTVLLLGGGLAGLALAVRRRRKE